MFADNIDIVSYADDTTPYVSGVTLDSTVKSLEKIADLLFTWFNYHQMKGNEDKCHVILSSQDNVHLNIGIAQIENSKSQKLLGINIDSKLTFEEHINRICKKLSAKLNALGRISYYMDPLKRRLLVNAFFTSQFNYCPLTWMFHSRKLNNKINRLHEMCPRLICSARDSSYEELLDKDNSVPIHEKNLQKLAIEMFKTYTGIAPQIMNKVFPRNCTLNYNLRCHPEFASRGINTVHYGSESLSFLGPKIWEMLPVDLGRKIWEMLPVDLKNSDSLDSFKSGIKNWRPQECPCRLCKRYIHRVGFTQISK